MASILQSSLAAPSRRVFFLDLFRGAFALLMLEGHTFRALLSSSFKTGTIYQLHEQLHSLTGPAFLFASGAAFVFASIPHWELHQQWNAKVARRFIRFAMLLAIGYMLHLTYFSLRRTLLESTPEQISYLLSMDILQCIGLSGLLLQILLKVLPHPRWFFRVTAIGSIVIGLSTQVVWGAAQSMPLWLRTSLSGRWGSVYPLFPHVGFYFAGAAAGYLFLESRQRLTPSGWLASVRRYRVWLAAASVVLFFVPLALQSSDFWKIGPGYFVPRLGILAFLLSIFQIVESRLLPSLSTLVTIGRESLLAYLSHLFVLHGSALNPDANLLRLLGTNCSPVVVSLVLLLLLLIMVGLCWAWNRLKRDHDWKAKGVQLSIAAYVVYCFVLT